MIKDLSVIMLAIKLSASFLPVARIEAFARAIQEQSVKININPMIFVAIATHESGWHERIISADGEDYGLLQIRKRYYKDKKEFLLDGVHNIKVGAYLIKVNKEMCQKVLNKEPETQQWLACYHGSCNSREHMCVPTQLTKQFEDYRICIEQDAMNNTNSKCRKIYWKNEK